MIISTTRLLSIICNEVFLSAYIADLLVCVWSVMACISCYYLIQLALILSFLNLLFDNIQLIVFLFLLFFLHFFLIFIKLINIFTSILLYKMVFIYQRNKGTNNLAIINIISRYSLEHHLHLQLVPIPS